MYETEWQVSQTAALAASVRPGRHGAHHELVWLPSGPAAAAQKASLLPASAVSPAAIAAQAALRQARVLQQIMPTPGALPCTLSTMASIVASPYGPGRSCAGGKARLVTHGALDIASGPAGPQPVARAAAAGMAGAALLRVAAAESPAWRWGNLDVGSFSAARISMARLPAEAPAPDVQGTSLQARQHPPLLYHTKPCSHGQLCKHARHMVDTALCNLQGNAWLSPKLLARQEAFMGGQALQSGLSQASGPVIITGAAYSQASSHMPVFAVS